MSGDGGGDVLEESWGAMLRHHSAASCCPSSLSCKVRRSLRRVALDFFGGHKQAQKGLPLLRAIHPQGLEWTAAAARGAWGDAVSPVSRSGDGTLSTPERGHQGGKCFRTACGFPLLAPMALQDRSD